MRWIGAFCPLLLGLAGLEVGKELSVLAHALVVVVLEEHDDLHLSLVAHLPDHGVVEQLNGLSLFLQRNVGWDADKEGDLIHGAPAGVLLGDLAEVEAQGVGVERSGLFPVLR